MFDKVKPISFWWLKAKNKKKLAFDFNIRWINHLECLRYITPNFFFFARAGRSGSI